MAVEEDNFWLESVSSPSPSPSICSASDDGNESCSMSDDDNGPLFAFSQLAKSRARLMVQGRRTGGAGGAGGTGGEKAVVEGGAGATCCAICLNDLTTATAALMHTPCAHVFHAPCFAALLKQRLFTCPLCRSDLQPALRLAPPSLGAPLLPALAPSLGAPSLAASLAPQAPSAALISFGAAWVHIIADDDVSLEDIRYLLTLLVQEPIL